MAEDFAASFSSIEEGQLTGAELVIGLVGAVGANLSSVEKGITACIKTYGYSVEAIRVSALIEELAELPSFNREKEYERIDAMMTAGNAARKRTRNNAVLALAATASIYVDRPTGHDAARPHQAYIINSLKHPDEVNVLRRIYGNGFFLLGVYVPPEKRKHNMIHDKNMAPEDADRLMRRDEEEGLGYGQRTRATFQLSDFFVHMHNDAATHSSLVRFFEVLFGHPNRTPLFDEYAMFMAFAAATRSADLSRQIGAVIARDDVILATGANECPRFGGGTYWPATTKEGQIVDVENGRDYMRGRDSNDEQKRLLINNAIESIRTIWKESGRNTAEIDEGLLSEALRKSDIDDITEYGRVVHAEMDALLTCARNNVSCQSATLYTTTYPCHNCAKHIIASGIVRVVYVEPYPKSKALQFHQDAAFGVIL